MTASSASYNLLLTNIGHVGIASEREDQCMIFVNHFERSQFDTRLKVHCQLVSSMITWYLSFSVQLFERDYHRKLVNMIVTNYLLQIGLTVLSVPTSSQQDPLETFL
mgnify:CR=1 FL=1